VSPGLLGFIIVCILGVLVWLLCRNMGKHLTKLDNEYRAEQEAAEAAERAAAAPAIPAQSGPGRPAKKKPAKARPTKA
jgi:hypothetical protein